MKFFDYIRLALKNIWRQKLRTILTVFSVVIGATCVLALLTIVFSASTVFKKQLESSGGLTQIAVSSSTDSNNQDAFGTKGGGNDGTGTLLTDAMVKKVQAIPHVSTVSPTLSVWAIQSFNLKGGDGKKFSAHNVTGYDPGSANDKALLAGRNFAAGEPNGSIILGSSYLTKLGYKANPQDLVGKTLVFTTQPGYSGIGAIIPTPPTMSAGGPMSQVDQEAQRVQQDSQQKQTTEIEATVVGVIAPGPYDDSAFIPMSWAQGMLTQQRWQQDPVAMEAYNQKQQQLQQQWQQTHHNGGQPPSVGTPPPMVLTTDSNFKNSGYQSLIVQVDNANDVESVAAEIRKLNLGAATAKDELAAFMKIINIVSLLLTAVGAIALIVAAIGVVNTMVMAALERTREIGVMRACGATRAAVRRLFTFEAAMLGFWGGVFGTLVTFILRAIGNPLVNKALLQQNVGTQNILQIPLWLISAVIGATTLIGLLAGLYPAFRAARLNPVEALRYE